MAGEPVGTFDLTHSIYIFNIFLVFFRRAFKTLNIQNFKLFFDATMRFSHSSRYNFEYRMMRLL
jgi:hypothetical protein